LSGVIAEGKSDGSPVAVVDAVAEVVLEVGARISVVGSHSDVVTKPVAEMLVAPGIVGLLLGELLDSLVLGRVVLGAGGAVEVSDGSVLFPVGSVLLLVTVPEVVSVPGMGVPVELLSVGPLVVLLPVSTVEVLFVTGGSPVFEDDVSETVAAVDVGGGSVAVAVEETPVPGPVIPSVAVEEILVPGPVIPSVMVAVALVPGPVIPSVAVAVAVTFGDGLSTLEITDEISLRTELSGLPGSVDELVTIPVGAITIELVVPGSTDVCDSVCRGGCEDVDCSVCAGVSDVVVAGCSTEPLVVVPGCGSTVDEDCCSCWLVEVAPGVSLVELGCCSCWLVEVAPGVSLVELDCCSCWLVEVAPGVSLVELDCCSC
jgi:hypothetical protein